jgi:hypothetical protein
MRRLSLSRRLILLLMSLLLSLLCVSRILLSNVRLSPYKSRGEAYSTAHTDAHNDAHNNAHNSAPNGPMVVMISGLKSRFTYLSDIANYTHISTIVIALHENHQSVDTESFSGSVKGKPRRPPYPLDEISITRHYKQLGVSTVVIRTFTSAQIDDYGRLSSIYKAPTLNLFPSDPTRTIRNLRMLTLRSMAYAMAYEVRPDFKLLLYKREDNYFLDGGRFKVDNVRMFCRGESEHMRQCLCLSVYVRVCCKGCFKQTRHTIFPPQFSRVFSLSALFLLFLLYLKKTTTSIVT